MRILVVLAMLFSTAAIGAGMTGTIGDYSKMHESSKRMRAAKGSMADSIEGARLLGIIAATIDFSLVCVPQKKSLFAIEDEVAVFFVKNQLDSDDKFSNVPLSHAIGLALHALYGCDK